ncbi:MAG: neutral/alkaline non-lysosomal ceramidase N-terminal domain-containing protein [Verrucomicrobiota bacterium]
MKRALHLLLVLSLLSVPAFAQPKAGAKRQFRAGAATSNITPPIGGNIVGGFNPFPSTHVHDDLHARCLVMDNGETRLALVVCDLLGADRVVYDEARRLVHEETGLPKANLLMSSTHTHSAVSALGANRFAYKQELDDYQKFVARRIADGVRRAINNLAPARVGWAVGHNANQVFNRRWFMKPGAVPTNPLGGQDEVKMNPPRGSKDLVKPAGPVDPEIVMLAVQSPEGRPIALFANYSLHYVGGVGNGHISADYFALFCDRMQQLVGADRQDPPFVAMLSNGTSGNINNIDFTKPAEKLPPYAKMRAVADDVAQSAYQAYQTIQYRDWAPLGAQFEEIEVGTRRPTPQQLERAQGIMARPKPAKARAATLEEIYAERTLRMSEWPAKIPIPLQALRVGDFAITTMPCEIFVEIGLELKQKNPFKPSCTVSISHGYFGYLPTPEHHQLGGYETWLGTNRLEVDASTKMAARLLEMLGRLK